MNYSQVWWDLPGSKSFSMGIVDDLQDGKNVIMCFPEHVPFGEKKDIHDKLYNLMEWHEFSINPDIEPLYDLYDKYVDSSPDEFRNINNLAENEQFQGKCIWVTGIASKESWEKWSDFIVKYEWSSRAIDGFDRTIFCIKLTGELALELPGEDVCLVIHKWENIIQSIDMLFFATQCFANTLIDRKYLELAILISTKIAKWDYDLYLRLANESIETLLNPEELLLDLALERQWVKKNQMNSNEEKWGRGQYNNGSEHPLLYRLDENYHHIDKLIWNAQLHVLFPYIEEIRINIIDTYKTVLDTKKDKLDHVYEIQIGFLYKILNENPELFNNNEQLIELARRLMKMRHSLAHLSKVDEEHLFSSEFKNAENILDSL